MIRKLARTAAIVFPMLALSSNAWGQLSFTTDFDGDGTGGGFSISAFQGSSSHESGGSSDRTGPGYNSSAGGDVQQFLKDRYEEQAERRAEEDRLQKEREQALRRQEVTKAEELLAQIERQQGDEPNVVKRMAYTQQVLALQKRFETARTAYMATLPSYSARLAASLNHINVPPPSHPLHYNRILIWGTMDTPKEARNAALSGLTDPFTGMPFDDVFAFGSEGIADFGRTGLDHLLRELDQLSPSTSSQLGELKGATADEVVCHSNGCRIATVLIATGMLKAERLRILGGDNVVWDLGNLRALKQQRGLTEVSVYLMKGDPVPLLDVGWQMMDLMQKIGQPLLSFQNKRTDPAYQMLGVTDRPSYSPSADIQVHVLTYPASSDLNLLDKHLYDHYSRVVNGLRMTKCLDAGVMSQRCIIY